MKIRPLQPQLKSAHGGEARHLVAVDDSVFCVREIIQVGEEFQELEWLVGHFQVEQRVPLVVYIVGDIQSAHASQVSV